MESWSSPHGWIMIWFSCILQILTFFQVAFCFLFNRCIKLWDMSPRHESIFKVMTVPAQSRPATPKGASFQQSHSWCSLVPGFTLCILPFTFLDALVHPGWDHYSEAEGVSWINSERHSWKLLWSQLPMSTDGGSPWKIHLGLFMSKNTTF